MSKSQSACLLKSWISTEGPTGRNPPLDVIDSVAVDEAADGAAVFLPGPTLNTCMVGEQVLKAEAL